MKTYTETEMLNLYRNALGLSRVLLLPAEQERQPVDRELLAVLRRRYLTLLATEDPDLLPVEDVGNLARLCLEPDNGLLTVALPDRCLRPVSFRLPGWRQPVYNIRRAGSPLHRNQRFPLLRATHLSPLVFRSADNLLVYGIPQTYMEADGCQLRAVAPPADDTFRLDESLLPFLLSD